MSKTVDQERAEDAERTRLDRSIASLKELLRILELRKQELPLSTIAQRIDRSRSTVYEREDLLQELIRRIGRVGWRTRRE